MHLLPFLGAGLLHLASFVSALELNLDRQASLKEASQQYAYGMMTYYKANASGLPKEEVGVFPKSDGYYWWEAGAAWGGLIEYTQFTGDTSYVKTLHQALVANYGPDNDIMLPWKKDQEGNDDQAFWALALMSALEFGFPDPDDAPASYLQVTEAAFKTIVDRWDTTSCNGGLKWQIYPENAYGYNYKNSISNGATFALGARLARYTGKQEYADWAVKIWDWSKAIGLIGDKYEVFDGTGDKENCTSKDHTEWSYNIGMYLHGSAVMYNFTNGEETWNKHTSGFLDHSEMFFDAPNSKGVMYEVACETGDTGRPACNLDQQSFKAYLSRFLAKTAIMAPFTKEKVTKKLRTSAKAAAKACSGGDSGVACGSRWYTGNFDGQTGVGQQLSALEVTQALISLENNIVPRKANDEVKPSPSSTKAEPSSTVAPSSSQKTEEPAKTTESPKESPKSTEAPQESSKASETPKKSSQAPQSPVASPSSNLSSSAVNTIPTNAGSPGMPDHDHEGPAESGGCNCTPSSTTTIYVSPPTTSAVAPPPPPPPASTTSANATVPVPTSPPANTTGPETFPGAAANTKATVMSVLGVAAGVIMSGLLL